MPRKSIADELVECPWQFVLGLAAAVFIATHYLIPRFLPRGSSSEMLYAAITTAAPTAGDFLTFVLVALAGISTFHRKMLRQKQR